VVEHIAIALIIENPTLMRFAQQGMSPYAGRAVHFARFLLRSDPRISVVPPSLTALAKDG
jgi:hypothetical protein